jgi:hypothetical protein
VGSHQKICVPESPRAHPVGPYSADFGGQVENEIGPRILEEATDVGRASQVVLFVAGNHRFQPFGRESIYDAGTQESGSAGNQNSHARLPPYVAAGRFAINGP